MTPRSRRPWGEFPPPDPHVWNTPAYRGVEQADGRGNLQLDQSPCVKFARDFLPVAAVKLFEDPARGVQLQLGGVVVAQPPVRLRQL